MAHSKCSYRIELIDLGAKNGEDFTFSALELSHDNTNCCQAEQEEHFHEWDWWESDNHHRWGCDHHHGREQEEGQEQEEGRDGLGVGLAAGPDSAEYHQ
jgi:hypothetical protein